MKRIILIVFAIALYSCGSDAAVDFYQGDSPIFPDYRDVTVPCNIAPLNFSYVSKQTNDILTTFTAGDFALSYNGRDVKIRPSAWEDLKEHSSSTGYIQVKSSVAGSWKIYVSPDKIDYGVTYRLVPPGYGLYGKLGIYEYDFQTAEQKVILENEAIESNCINCHSFNGTDPSSLCMHIRGIHSGTLMLDDNDLKVFNTMTEQSGGNCVYPYWHPSGDFIAFSVNKTKQSFYINPEKLIEVFDLWSDMWVYDIRGNKLFTNDSLCGDDYFETFPAFSADGKSLFFCRTHALDSLDSKEKLHYSLCRVSFDPKTATLGTEVETLIDADKISKSILFPRPSYDGRYLAYTCCDFGTFPIWHKESDLWLLDLQTGEIRPLDGANSNDTESYHSWSTDSRWMVFSSRRDDTRFTRLYVSHIDENGYASKAFLLPQKNPVDWYNRLFYSYNVPNFVSGPVCLPKHKAIRSINSQKRELFQN